MEEFELDNLLVLTKFYCDGLKNNFPDKYYEKNYSDKGSLFMFANDYIKNIKNYDIKNWSDEFVSLVVIILDKVIKDIILNKEIRTEKDNVTISLLDKFCTLLERQGRKVRV